MKLELQEGSRSHILLWFLLAIIFVFILRLFYLQVIRHDHYVALASNEQLKSLEIPAKRGVIYAMDGDTPVPLVMNRAVYTVFADPQIVTDEEAVIKAVQEIAGGNARSGLSEMLADKDSRYKIMATKLTRTQADKLKAKRLAGVGFQEESQRDYPEGGLAGQILGFVNAEGDGSYGVESALNDRLKGEAGRLQTVTDVRDVPLTIGDNNINIPAKDGDNIALSIDRNIQSHTEDALKRGIEKAGATNGSVIVMDPSSGRVMAMANYPSYKPAEYGKVTDAAWFNNAVISSPYEPASVIKTFTLATGIDRGVIKPSSTYYNTDSIRVEDVTIRNAFRGLVGELSMQDVLNNSLNTGTVVVAQRLGDGKHITRQARDIMYDYFYNRFGLGQVTGIELANESAGLVISPKELEGNAVRYSNMTFGQGLNVTMVQVAAAFSSVVNGGKYYQPSIIAGTVADGTLDTKNNAALRQPISAQTSSQMRDMLQKARNSVSYMRDADKKGYVIGGKTGTAETLRDGRYVKSETVGTYLGYGGGDTPEYVIMVQVSAPNRNLEGGIHASPIFTDISNWLIDYLRIPPKG